MIDSLAYIGFSSPRAEEWLDFGPEILGLEVAGRGPDGAVRLRLDEAAHRIAVHPGPADELAYLGWAVADESAVDSARSSLAEQGIEVQRGDSAARGAARSGRGGLVRRSLRLPPRALPRAWPGRRRSSRAGGSPASSPEPAVSGTWC